MSKTYTENELNNAVEAEALKWQRMLFSRQAQRMTSDWKQPSWVGYEGEEDQIAVLAMLKGQNYDSTAANLSPTWDFEEELLKAGYAMTSMYRHRPDDMALRDEWPPAPFAGVHVCTVKSNKDSPMRHRVIMLADGTVLDPMTDQPMRLEYYEDVDSVAAVGRIV